MVRVRQLELWMFDHASPENYLFHIRDLKNLFADMSYGAFKTFLNRAVQAKVIENICYGLYGFQVHKNSRGYLLFHAASCLRSEYFNYISLESVLCEEGYISQVPISRIFVMTTGRTQIIDCGLYGSIEFIHTQTPLEKIMHDLAFDEEKRLWRANAQRALIDMKKTKRSLDLVRDIL